MNELLVQLLNLCILAFIGYRIGDIVVLAYKRYHIMKAIKDIMDSDPLYVPDEGIEDQITTLNKNFRDRIILNAFLIGVSVVVLLAV